MKTFFVLLFAAIAVTLVISEGVYSESQIAEWNEFKTTYRKNYDEAENTRRLKIFTDNKQRISEHNAKYSAGQVSYKQAINEFTDKLPEELARGHGKP